MSPSQPSQNSPQHAWQGKSTWRMLSTNFGHGETFLQSWVAWQTDAARSQQLHFTAVLASPLTAESVISHAPASCQLQAQMLAQAIYGLLPGVHRLSFEQGRVLLTLWVGDIHAMLRQQASIADALLLPMPFADDAHSIKALARHCQRGTVLHAAHIPATLQRALESAGFVFMGTYTHTAHYAPRWEPRKRATEIEPFTSAGTAFVVGAGLAGSAVAYSLALRGWNVTVLGTGETPADGASGLPAGLFCPHVSPDDNVLSRLSRSGVRMTLQRLRDVCQEGQDWGLSGVLEHCTDGGTGLPTNWTDGPGTQWSQTTDAAQLQAAGLDVDTVACWHTQAGWVRPAQLVAAQLAHPRIHFQGKAHVDRVVQTSDGVWQAFNTDGLVLAQADLAILACGPGTPALLPKGTVWPLQSLRGQITWGLHTSTNATALPPFPVNGNGNLVTHVPLSAGTAWIMGSTFERDVDTMPISEQDQVAAHAVNYEKLSTLLPQSAEPLRPWFTPTDECCQPTWGNIRVASHDRLPIAGPVNNSTNLWALTALGARGLTLSVLCGELIAAQLHEEPLPLDYKLAQHLGSTRPACQGHSPSTIVITAPQ